MGTEHKCQWCGKEFEPTCHKSRQKFCSAECRIKYHNAKRYYGGRMDVCPECGEPVEQSGERGRWRRFCSDRCRQEYHRKQRQEKQHEQGRGKQVCPNCGVEFELDWNCKTRRFCSVPFPKKQTQKKLRKPNEAKEINQPAQSGKQKAREPATPKQSGDANDYKKPQCTQKCRPEPEPGKQNAAGE